MLLVGWIGQWWGAWRCPLSSHCQQLLHVKVCFLGSVPPASDDGGAFEGDFATMPVKEYLTPGITQGGHQEELVGEAGETVS